MTIPFEKLKARLFANPKVKAEYDALVPELEISAELVTGTTFSPFLYDAVTRCALQSANLRWPAILCYASSAAVFPTSQHGPVTFDSGPVAQSLD